MRKTIRELRLARGWRQEDLAREIHMERPRLSKIENQEFGARPDELRRICEALECLPEDLELAPTRPVGGRKAPPLGRFRAHPEPLPLPQVTSAARIGGLWRAHPRFMATLSGLPLWRPFLERAPSESGDETLLQLLELHRGATMVDVTTDQMGFRTWPVIDEDGRGASSYLRPALMTQDWLLTFQVWVQTPRKRYRLDGLLLVLEPQRTILNLEVDGDGHDPSWDHDRATALGMKDLRIRGRDLLNGPSLTERLRAKGFCQPRARRSS